MRITLGPSVVRGNIDESITGLWSFANALGLLTDVIGERTPDAGVTIDGVNLVDRQVVVADYPAVGHAALLFGVLGDAQFRFRVQADGLLEWGDGLVVRDVNLFRSAANILATNDDFLVGGPAGLITDIITERTGAAGVTIDGVLIKDKEVVSPALAGAGSAVSSSSVSGDSSSRFVRNADGGMEWGPGDAVRDTNLFRAAADELKTSDAFTVGGILKGLGMLVVSTKSTALVAESNNFDTGNEVVQRVTSDTTRSITGFAGGVAGRVMAFLNANAVDIITLVHESGSSLAANRIIMPNDASRGIDDGAGVLLVYDGVSSRWRAVFDI